MNVVEKGRKAIINTVYFSIFVALGFLFFRYAFGVCMPLIIAFFVAAILQKPKNYLSKKTFLKEGLASTLCVFAALFIFLSLIALIGVRIVDEIKGFIDYVSIQLRDIDGIIDNIEAWLLNIIASFPSFIKDTLSENTSELFSKLREIIAGKDTETVSHVTEGIGNKFQLSWLSGPLSGVISTARQVPSFLIAFVVTIVASCFMTKEYPKMIEFFVCQIPESKRKDFSRGTVLLKDSLSKMIKAYLLIILVTFAEMSLGLTALKLIGIFESNYIVIIALITAIVDIIPILGTGTILLPWAVYSLIVGDIGMSVGLLVIYAVISVVRQVIEPKLVAGQLGLSPVVTISALYLGLRFFGVLGMFVCPIAIIMLKLLNDEGIIKIWKSPKKEKEESAEKEEKE